MYDRLYYSRLNNGFVPGGGGDGGGPTGTKISPGGGADDGSVKLVAMEDFEHEEDGDLGFVEGDLLLGMKLKGEWWTGKYRDDGSGSGSIGHFPNSYVAKEGEEHLWAPTEESESEESEEESEMEN